MIFSMNFVGRPKENSLIPHSTGYLIYSGILQSLDDEESNNNSSLSDKIHDDIDSKVSISPLRGEFKREDKNRKYIYPDQDYRFSVNILDYNEAFETLFSEYVLEDHILEIGDSNLEIIEFESEKIDYDDLYSNEVPEKIFINFQSPTCIKYKFSGVTEMYPHREAIFESLKHSWSVNSSEDIDLSVDSDKIKRNIVEQPIYHKTHNLIVNRKYVPEKGHKIPIKEFGFTGKANYSFKNAESEFKKKIATLSRFAKYSGIGSHTSRGCGNVFTEVNT